jgi:hypothetical protein
VPEYTVVFARSARKELQALDRAVAARILKRIEARRPAGVVTRPLNSTVSPHMRRVLGTILLSCTLTQLNGCDRVWVQKSSVSVRTAIFPQCVTEAFAEDPSVSVGPIRDSSISLVTPLALEPLGKRVAAYIVRPPENVDVATTDVRFVGYGFSEHAEDRERVSPLLDHVVARLGSHCGAG